MPMLETVSHKLTKKERLPPSIPLGKTLSVWNETGKRGIISMTDTEVSDTLQTVTEALLTATPTMPTEPS